jgi:transposase
MSKKRQKFTKSFKLEAVQLVDEGRYSVPEAAERLGVSEQALYRWRKALKDEGVDAFRGNGNLTSEQECIRKLEAENRRLRMERDFLKKTAAYFAKDEK